MENELRERIKPLIDTFIEGMIKIEDAVKEKGENFERQALKTENERTLLREGQVQNDKSFSLTFPLNSLCIDVYLEISF